ncbi:MAG: division/cell wall cluster transcriptional repressor MraZ [Thermoleophilia bacterium]
MQRPVLVGEFEVTLDAKNRIAVPARLRSAFAEGIYVAKVRERCLGGYGPHEFAERLAEEAAATGDGSVARRDAKRFTAANAVHQPGLDGQGRVTVPARLLGYAGITRDVTVIGAQDHVEFWDRAAWAAYLAHLEEEADATADELAAS